MGIEEPSGARCKESGGVVESRGRVFRQGLKNRPSGGEVKP